MPYYIRKLPNKKCYELKNKKTKHAFSKCTTLSKAKKQLRLLNAIKYNKSFKPRARTGGRKTRKNRRD